MRRSGRRALLAIGIVLLLAPWTLPTGATRAPPGSPVSLGASAARGTSAAPVPSGVTRWTPDPVIPLASSGPGGEPSIAVNRYGTLLVGWMDWAGNPATPPGVNEYAASTDQGRDFTAAKSLPITIQRYESDVSIVTAPANGTFWLGYQSQPTACSASSSGVTVTSAWDNATRLSSPQLSMPCANQQFYDREWLGSTPNGTLFQVADVPVVNDSAIASPALFVARDDNGTGFGAPRLVANGSYIAVGAAAYNDSLWSIGDTSSTGMACTIYLSRDGGSSWGRTPAPLPSDCSSAKDPASGIRGAEWQLAWGAGGELIVAYVNGSGVEVTRSADLGASWSSPELISGPVPAGTAFQTPTIATNRSTGEVAIGWLDTRAGNTSWQVELAASSDNGATWSGPGEISDGPVGTGARFWPGDFIGSTLTPWGTDAVVWGGENSTGVLLPWFTQVPVASYEVSFQESGLPSGTRWSIALNGTSLGSGGTTISFLEPDGSYAYVVGRLPGYAADISGGSLWVDGAAVTVGVGFSQVLYFVDFNETGLPARTNWSVSIAGEPELTAAVPMISFSLPNGSYTFTCGRVARFSATPESGSLTVNGSDEFWTLKFSPLPLTTFVVSFLETGLASGSAWSVRWNGTSLGSTSSVIQIEATNGSYPFSIAAPSGYVANLTAGRANVTGAPVTISLAFSVRTVPNASSPLGPGPLLIASVLVALVALLAVVLLYQRRRRRRGGATLRGPS